MAKQFQSLISLHRALPWAAARGWGAVFPLQQVATLLIALLLCMHPGSARSATGACSEPTPAAPVGSQSAEQEGLKVFIDPDTGELISAPAATDGTQPAEAPAKAPDQPELPVEVRPDGTLVLDLSENPVNELRVEKVDGKLIECHHEVSAQSEDNDASQHESGTDRAGADRDDER